MSAQAQRFKEHSLFQRYEKAWQPVLSHIHTKHSDKDETIMHHGTPASSLWLVLSGWVALMRQTPDGKETVIGLCTAGDVFGEAALFAHANYPYSAVALSDQTELASVAAPILREMIEQHSDFSSHVMSILGDRIAKAQLKVEQMSTLTAAQRLGCFLLRLCQNTPRGPKILHMPVEKNIIASFLGMKPETLSRSFQHLGEVGIKVAGANVTVANVEDLRDYVCGSCGESGMCATEDDAINLPAGQH